MSEPHWVSGDLHGLSIPGEAAALREGGTEFLTRAFQAEGALAADNRVVAITRFEDCPGGSTGRKLFLSVGYERPEPGLPEDLFVKFSRAYDDPVRDRGRHEMAGEVRFAELSRLPDFPVPVPACLFADYHHESGTGILITERIGFGEGAVEPLYEKCRDHQVPAPLEHYRTLVATVARLAGAHRGGRLGTAVEEHFPFDAEVAATSDPLRHDAAALDERITRFAAFAARYPQLVPDALADPGFLAQLRAEVPRFVTHFAAIKRHLSQAADLIALCHWNANVDNAWFWRDDAGALRCGLIDWGRVGQMNVGLALWGGLSAAEPELLEAHLDDLLALFAAEYRAAGGPAVTAAQLSDHMALFVATMGLAYMMDVPAAIEARLPDLAQVRDRFDPRFANDDRARCQLHILLNVLHLWRTRDFGGVLDRVLDAPTVRHPGSRFSSNL